MFKKLLVASAILAASSSVFAGSFKGENYKGEMVQPCTSCQFTAGPYVGFSVGSRTNWASPSVPTFKGFSGNLSVGYAMMVNPVWYLGGEFFAGNTARLSARHNGSLRSTWDYGLDVIPGVMISDSILGYARGGVIRTEFSGRKNGMTGWRVGLGLQANLVQNWDGRMEYVYNQFDRSKGKKNQADQVNLGVVYKFL